MHSCLRVDEIVRLVACELVALRGHATSVALACCGKSFEDPVLDTLWEIQEDLLRLLKTLPGDVWKEGGCPVSSPTTRVSSSFNYFIQKSFARLPTPPEWARFRKYARRMRTLWGLGALATLSLEMFSVLQLRAISEPLFPNLKALILWTLTRESIPFFPLFLSPRITTISIFFDSCPPATVASIIADFPTLCPNLQDITLYSRPTDPMITAAFSRMLLTSNKNTLRYFRVGSTLTEEAREVVYRLPDLWGLSVVIEGGTSLPTVILPNLVELDIECDHDFHWLQGFRGAIFGKLASVTFFSDSKPIGDPLEAFVTVALTTSISATLSTLKFSTSLPWRPNYRSLLPLTRLQDLIMDSPCERGCSSTIDDDIVSDIARAMPKLQYLRLGEAPCKTPAGVTAKGLAALAYYCLHLVTLNIHFQVATLDPSVILGVAPDGEPSVPREGCALTDLDVGEISLPEGSTLAVASTLLRIFPHIRLIESANETWEEVKNTINLSRRRLASGEELILAPPRKGTLDTLP